jgi:hypothetical protein
MQNDGLTDGQYRIDFVHAGRPLVCLFDEASGETLAFHELTLAEIKQLHDVILSAGKVTLLKNDEEHFRIQIGTVVLDLASAR